MATLLSGCAYDAYGRNGYGDGYGSSYGNGNDYGYDNRNDNGGNYDRGSSRAFDCRRDYDRRYCSDNRR